MSTANLLGYLHGRDIRERYTRRVEAMKNVDFRPNPFFHRAAYVGLPYVTRVALLGSTALAVGYAITGDADSSRLALIMAAGVMLGDRTLASEDECSISLLTALKSARELHETTGAFHDSVESLERAVDNFTVSLTPSPAPEVPPQ